MSYHVKKKFSEKRYDPEECRVNLKEAYENHVELILGEEIWEDDGTLFFNSDKEFARWAVEPSQATETAAMAAVKPPAAQPIATSSLPDLPSALHSGYPPVIVLSVAFLSTVYLAYDKIIDPGLAVLLWAFALLLFFGPQIIEKLAKFLPLSKMIDKERTISELFEMAHEIFRHAIVGKKNAGKYEHSGNLAKDPAAINKLKTVAALSDIYREIFLRSEREWYQRVLIEQETAVRMANGGGTGSTSDVPG